MEYVGMLNINKLVTFFYLFFFGFFVLGQGYEQENKQEKSREGKKAHRQEVLAQNLDSITAMINQKSFALEASMVHYDNSTYNAFQENNFIQVSGEDMIIQTANIARLGVNGMGGITIRGRILSFDVVESKKHTSINMIVSTFQLGIINVSLSVNSSGNTTAFVRGNFGLRVTFVGDFAPLDDHDQIKGVSRF